MAEEISVWHGAADVRVYVATLCARLSRDPGIDEETRSRIDAWCEWAEGWARKVDPVENPERIRGLVVEDEHSSGLSLELELRRRILETR